MPNTKVKSFYHNTGNGQVFCTIVGQMIAGKECLIYLAPLFEERMWTQRIAFNFAKSFWENTGQPVLIFDYYGYGESDGDTEDFSLNRCLHNLQSLLDLIQSEYNVSCFSLWGIRTGAFLALYLHQQISSINSLLLWAPVFDLKKFIYQQLRSTVASQGTIFKKINATRDVILQELLESGKCERDGYILNHIDGYRIGKPFWQEVVASGSIDGASLTHNCPVLFLNIIPLKGRKTEHRVPKHQEDGYQNFVYETVESNSFWNVSLDYSQKADTVYNASLAWWNNRTFK